MAYWFRFALVVLPLLVQLCVACYASLLTPPLAIGYFSLLDVYFLNSSSPKIDARIAGHCPPRLLLEAMRRVKKSSSGAKEGIHFYFGH